MKYLDASNTGGQPVFLDDLDWELLGIKEAFKGLVSSFVPTGGIVILYGCSRSVSGSTVTISAGYALFNGEVCRVPAHTFADGSTVEFWVETIVFDPSGTVNFNTPGVTHDLYAERILTVQGGATLPVGTTEYAATKTLSQYVHLSMPFDSWHLFRTHTEGAASSAPGTYQLYAKKDLSGFVHLRGTMYFEDIGSGAVNELAGTLPVGLRPAVNQTFAISTISNNITGEVSTSTLVIQTNGEIYLKAVSMGFAFVLDFGQITPFSTT